MALGSRYLAVLTAAALIIIAFVVVVLTAPISELHIGVQNLADSDTVHMVLYLDDSTEAYSCAGPGMWVSWKFHVVPGTHNIEIDYVFNQSLQNEPDQVIDFAMTTYVGFNGVKCDWLIVDEEGIGYHPADFFDQTSSPLEQAINDSHVIAPAVALAVLHVAFIVGMLNLRKTQQEEESGKEP